MNADESTIAMAALPKAYEPAQVEEKWHQRWLDDKVFHASHEGGGTPYCIVIPPPNVTGVLHMGHALNNTLQDILVRTHRMQGDNTLWMPGTDHAGIATQNVVERELKKEGLTRDDVGRDAFIERVWAWREKSGGTIIRQLERLGASCDWERERFTMDEGLSDAVAEVFIHLYNKKLIYRGNYIINWCPRCHTALADEESEHVDTNGRLYYIRYPIKGGKKSDGVIVATTRPETLLGDVAVAVNPRDERYRHLVGKSLLLPILNRELVVIEDDFVDPDFGTGVVKVTPAHDPNDFVMGNRHNLTPINVMNGDGTMNEAAGVYAGMDRMACRKKLVDDLEAAKMIEKIEDHRHAVGHCYRCDTQVEPRLSLQWFVKMRPLARPAIDAVKDGRITFTPERWSKVYLDWMENIRDWCISRQIWWGHRIPVYYCDGCDHEWAAKAAGDACPQCGSDSIRQDADVLDTWFSSWLWPFSTFGWPERNKDLEFYYPTNTLVTDPGIIFFWVARMIMAGLEFMGDIPFRDVCIHGVVRDQQGRRMSKSLGNGIDPVEIIDQYSADALRFTLTMITSPGHDVLLSAEKFEQGRNFCNKIWNAARFMQQYTTGPVAHTETPDLDPDQLSSDDKHILARLHETIAECTTNLDRFRVNDVAHQLYDFAWNQFCSWYVEYSKDVLNGDDEARREQVLRVMHYVFGSTLKLLHPITPFITEELWESMGYGDGELLVTSSWPKAMDYEDLSAWKVTRSAALYVDQKHEIIRAGRMLKADYNIAASKRVGYVIKPESEKAAARLSAEQATLVSLLRAQDVIIDATYAPTAAAPSSVAKLGTIYMPIDGLIDIPAELERLNAQMAKLNGDVARIVKKLENVNFLDKAPESVVEQQKERRAELGEKIEKVKRLIDSLTDMQ